MINLTRKVILQTKWKKIYLALKTLLYVSFLLTALFVVYQILFPEISLDYSFSNVNSLKNTLFSARTTSQNPAKNGTVGGNDTLSFDANPLGNFEDAKLNFVLNKNSAIPKKISVKVRKSYSAFFYPQTTPLGFANGSLLSVNGVYYIISNGKTRQFVSGSALDQLGYSRSAFLRISPTDLKYNPPGENILNADSYPDDTLIVIGNQYYQFKNQQLLPFVSERAFLSRYQPTQAIQKNEDFLKDKTVSENFVGFADGTLASSDQSVFILSKGNSYPIADSATFVAMGFDWNNVLSLTPAEINAYKRQKQFTINQPHPDGTLFYDKNEDKYFFIDSGFKYPIENKLIASTYTKVSPVLINTESLEQNISCSPTKAPLTFRTFTCQLSLNSIDSLLGNDYQFETSFGNDVKLASVNVVFYTKLNQTNVLSSLSIIKNRLQNNYVKN